MLTLILPSYNGSSILLKSVPQIKELLLKSNIDFEIIIVEDGSEDKKRTEEIAAEFGCIFLENEKNQGKGAAVKRGVKAARGDVILFTDIDLPFGAGAVVDFYNRLMLSDADVLMGDRTLPESDYFSKIPASRKQASLVFSWFIRLFVLRGDFDTQCGLKAFKNKTGKEIFKEVRINRFAFDVEVLVIAKKRNLKIMKAPVRFVSSQEGASANLLKQAGNMLFDLMWIRFNRLVGRY